jgi:predicted O-methyltransferase YrrM
MIARFLAYLAKNYPELTGYEYIVKKFVDRYQKGQISVKEARFLQSLVRKAPPDRPIIEIGTLFGTSTKAMAVAKQEDTVLITVDNYSWNPFHISPDLHFEITRSTLNNIKEDLNIQQVRSSKDDFYRTYNGKQPGLVFFDAMHTFQDTKKDIEWAQSVNADIISGHDYDEEEWPGVAKAVRHCGGAAKIVDSIYVMNKI